MSKFRLNNMEKIHKRKGFVIDKITEDSFYENLLLGLTTVLKSCPFVSQIKLDRYPPVTAEEVAGWECASGFGLPEDLRNFYLSTNGFSFTYKFQYNKEETEEATHIVAGIEINPLANLEEISIDNSMYLTETGMKIMAPHSKMFVLAKLDEENCVVMAHFNLAKAPNFWLYYKMKIFYLLCEDFTTYFRMALAYLGVPGWQLAVLKASLPEWSAELFQILAPGILDNRQLFENQTENNVLDANIFNVTDDGKPSTLVSKSFVEEKKGVGSVSGKFKRKSAKGRFKK